MPRSLRLVAVLAALVLVAGCATTRQSDNQADTSDATLQAQAKLAADAATVLQQQMLQPSQRRIPHALAENARCIAVFPSVLQAGLIVGGSHGRGLIVCRQRSGNFNHAPPAVYSLSSASIGLQAGASRRSVVLFFNTLQSTRAVYDSLVKLGSQVAVTAGPRGYDQPIDPNAAIVAYGISKDGLFAGLNLGGAKVAFDDKANTAIYDDPEPMPREILLQTNEVPRAVRAYTDAVEAFTQAGDTQ